MLKSLYRVFGADLIEVAAFCVSRLRWSSAGMNIPLVLQPEHGACYVDVCGVCMRVQRCPQLPDLCQSPLTFC